jgi:hypothetical protein
LGGDQWRAEARHLTGSNLVVGIRIEFKCYCFQDLWNFIGCVLVRVRVCVWVRARVLVRVRVMVRMRVRVRVRLRVRVRVRVRLRLRVRVMVKGEC